MLPVSTPHKFRGSKIRAHLEGAAAAGDAGLAAANADGVNTANSMIASKTTAAAFAMAVTLSIAATVGAILLTSGSTASFASVALAFALTSIFSTPGMDNTERIRA